MFPDSRGFTLIEVMVGIAIIVVAFIPAAIYFSDSIIMVNQAEIKSQAHKIAGDAMEVFKQKAAASWDTLETEADNFTIADIESGYDLFADDYTLQVRVTGFDFDGDGDIDSGDSQIGRKLSVMVGWNDGSRSVQLASLIRKK